MSGPHNGQVPSPTRRREDNDSSATRRRILDVAAYLFATRGFASTTTRDIAAHVDIRQPSLYKHFRSKDEILHALFEQAAEYPVRVTYQLRKHESVAAVLLYRWLHELAAHMLAHPFLVATLLRTQELRNPRFSEHRTTIEAGNRMCADLIAAAVAAGDFRPIDPVLATRFILGLYEAVAPIRIVQEPDELMLFVFHALLTDPSRLALIRTDALRLDLAGPGADSTVGMTTTGPGQDPDPMSRA